MKKVEKIEIEGEGMQILHLLMKKYRLTKKGVLQKYADKLGIYDTTVNQYLKNKAINNDKFKRILSEDFGKDYEEIAKTAENQIIYYIVAMRDEIHLYNEEKDLLNTIELIQLCQQHNLPYYRLIAMGNRARIKGNMRLNSEAKPLLEEVIEEAKEQGYLDLYIYYTTNLAYIYNNNEDYSISRKRLRDLETMVKEEDIENKWVLHKYWYIYAVTMQYMGMYPTSSTKFKLAYQYAEDINDKIKTLLNIALTYKLDRRYVLAMEWNEKALKASSRNRHLRSCVLNNIANFHYDKGNMDQARKFINKAMSIMPENLDISKKVNIFSSYLKMEEECESVCEGIVDILLDTEKATENRRYLYLCLDRLIEKLVINNNIKLLIRLRDQLNLLIKAEENQGDLIQLKARFGEVMIYLMEKGGVTTC